jgi:hypothetical protein
MCGGEVNWLFLRREYVGNSPVIVDAAGTTLLDGREFDLGHHAGVEASVWTLWDEETRIAGRYMGLDSRTDQRTVDVPAGGGLATNPITPTGPVDVLRYQSSLQSAEIGLQQNSAEFLRLGGGFRYVEFNERLRDDVFTAALAPQGFNQFVTKNDLFGLQGTANLSIFEVDGLALNGFGAAGVYYNHADSTAATQFIGGPAASRTGDTDGGVAFVGEAGLNFNGRITENVSWNAGYRVLYLQGVALAADQVRQTNGTFTSTRTDSDGAAFLHGITMGVNWQF